jgi:hypothetical protein
MLWTIHGFIQNEEFRDFPLSILFIAEQTRARTRLSQPPFRHGVIEMVKADGRNGNRATAARDQVHEKVPTALDAMLM